MTRPSFVCWVLSAFALPMIADTVCDNLHPVTEAGTRFTDGRAYDPALPVNTVGQAGSRYVRVNIRVEHASEGPWVLRVRDERDHLLQVFTETDFTSASNRWTSR